jgi:hypothetical protein
MPPGRLERGDDQRAEDDRQGQVLRAGVNEGEGVEALRADHLFRPADTGKLVGPKQSLLLQEELVWLRLSVDLLLSMA